MCYDSTVLSVFKFINSLINIAKVIIPLIIIVVSILDISKESTGFKDISYNKTLSKIGIRLASAVLIFFVPSILNTILNVVDTDYSEDNLACLLNVTEEDINNARMIELEDYIAELTYHYTSSTYSSASYIANAITEEEIKDIYVERLESIKKTHQDETNQAMSNDTEARIAAAQEASTTKTSNTSGVISGNFPYYNQYTEPYTYINGYDAQRCGCGYMSLSTIIDGLTGNNYTPIGVVEMLPPGQYASGYCPVLDSTFYSPDLVSKFGVRGTIVFSRVECPSDAQMEERKQLIVDTLSAGKPMVVLIPGHYIALVGINNGYITAYDPANSDNNGSYTIDELANKFYSYSDASECGFVYGIGYELA